MQKTVKTIFVFFAFLFVMITLSVATIAQTAAETTVAVSYKTIGAALAIGLSGIGAGYAIGVAGAAGASALTEKPELFSNILLIVALGEGIAIYGLIVAILILIR